MMNRHTFFYQILLSTFCVIVVLSNIISAKMVKLPFFELAIPAGLITYPLTFLLSDLVTEIYGGKMAKSMVYTAFAMNILSFVILEFALVLPNQKMEEQKIFEFVFGLSGIRIFASLVAYLLSQLVDIQLYVLIKKWTHERFLWLRNNGSTITSQLVDTVLIDLIFLYWGMKMPFEVVLPIIVFSFIYKSVFSIAMTPIFYLLVYAIRRVTVRQTS